MLGPLLVLGMQQHTAQLSLSCSSSSPKREWKTMTPKEEALWAKMKQGEKTEGCEGRREQIALIIGLNSQGKSVPCDTWRYLRMRQCITPPQKQEPSRPGRLHVQRPCCRSTLGQVKKQKGGTQGGEKGRYMLTEAAAAQGWLCNWPKDCGLEGAWLFLNWDVWRGDGGNSTETPKGQKRLQKTDGPKNCHTEWSKSDKEAEITYDISCMWNLKRHDATELICKTERDWWT